MGNCCAKNPEVGADLKISSKKSLNELTFPILNTTEEGFKKTILTDRLAHLSMAVYDFTEDDNDEDLLVDNTDHC